MLSKLREPFGKAGLTVAIVALVMAMVGGAYAAGALTGKQKKEVEKIAKKYAGTNGANGTNGAAGEKGAKGDAGGAGSNGTNGTPGPPGAAGKSVVLVSEEPAGCPNEEGVAYEVEDSGTENEVCNGETGFTSTLPTGKTETGAWSYSEMEALENNVSNHVATPVYVSVSFPIPLSAGLSEGHGHFIYTNHKELVLNLGTGEVEEVTSSACTGTAEAPTAEPGNLCIYAARLNGTLNKTALIEAEPAGVATSSASISDPSDTGAVGFGKTGPTGARLLVSVFTGRSDGYGSWAVTAP